MSRIFIFFFLVFLQSFVSRAQNTLYDFIELGDYQVGFMDTIIFDTKYQYEAFDYVGNKPSFIQIWYPMAVLPANPNCLKFADLFDGSKTDMLSNVQAQLIRNYQEAVFRDCIEENTPVQDV